MSISNPILSIRQRSRYHKHTLYAVCGLSIVLIIVTALNIMLGEQNIRLITALRALLGYGDPEQIVIVQTLRAPRAIIAMLVGAALAVSGAILQG